MNRPKQSCIVCLQRLPHYLPQKKTFNQPDTPFKEQLHGRRLDTAIETGHKQLRSVTCLNKYMIWTSGETRDTKCLNVQGSLLQIIKTISVTILTDNRSMSE